MDNQISDAFHNDKTKLSSINVTQDQKKIGISFKDEASKNSK